MRKTFQFIKRLTSLQKSTITILSIALSGLYLSGWKPLKIQGNGGGHNYPDLSSVFNAAACFREIGSGVYAGSGDCSYQYGLFLLRVINVFHLDSLSPLFMGGILFAAVALFMVAIGVLASTTRGHVVLICLILLSPGPWLLFERGNFDLLIIIFLAITILTLNTKFSSLGAVFLLATALMKFYTFPLVILYLLIEKEKWHKTVVAISSLATIPFILNDIISASGHPNPMFGAFGLPIPGLWINFFAWRFGFDLKLGTSSLYLIGIFFFLAAYLYYKKSRVASHFRKMATRITFESALEEKIFLFSSFTYVTCFLAGSNFDYRLIFLAIALVLLNKAMAGTIQSKLMITVELLALWLTYFYFGALGAIPVLLSIAGNAAQLVLAVFLFSYLFNFCLRDTKTLLVTRFGFHKP